MKQIVKDARPSFYMIQNEVLDKYGATIGPLGIAVYNALCRFASRDGTAFPSLHKLAEITGMSRPSVTKYLRVLKDCGLIDIESRTTDAGDSDSNWYTIKDCVGVGNDVAYVVNDVTNGRQPDLPRVGNDVSTNNTYLNNTQLPIPPQSENGSGSGVTKKERGAVHKCWQENMSGTMTPIIGEEINELIDEYGPNALIHAITVAVNANARTMRYVKGVLAKDTARASPSNGNGKPAPVTVQRMEGEDW